MFTTKIVTVANKYILFHCL